MTVTIPAALRTLTTTGLVAACGLVVACAGDDTATTATTASTATATDASVTDSDPTATTEATTIPGTTTDDPSGTGTDSSTTTSDSDSDSDSTTADTSTTADETTTTDGTTTMAIDSESDTDTDSESDSDTEGTTTEGECVPMGPEICNGIDDDCDGEIDNSPKCEDSDNDGIPDAYDPFPDNDMLPGIAEGNVVYAQTSSRLFTMDANTYDIVEIGPFSYNQNPGSVTDIALDRWGILWAITFNHLFVCNPNTAQCYHLGVLPGGSTNGLTVIPAGILDPEDEVLVAIANNGNWFSIKVEGGQANFTQIGQYGPGYSSSGDAFSIQGVGTYGACDKQGVPGDVIVSANPENGNVLEDIGVLSQYSTIYGLAGWQGKIFAFNSGGQIILVDPQDGSFEVIKQTNHTWWGAGVYSVLPQ